MIRSVFTQSHDLKLKTTFLLNRLRAAEAILMMSQLILKAKMFIHSGPAAEFGQLC